MIDLKKDFKYSLMVATSMGIRITPVNGQPVHSSKLFEMQNNYKLYNNINLNLKLCF